MSFLPLPRSSTQLLLDRIDYRDSRLLREGITHSGLLLDRFAPYERADFSGFEQTDQKRHIERIAAASSCGDSALLGAWNALAEALPEAIRWEQRTIWRLAGQLARATTLENGSACLHPLYGFAYLPGSGLKGLTRAWAHQQYATGNRAEIQRIFGSFDEESSQKEAAVRFKTDWSKAAGTVVFLESWPKRWPKLECDIVNNHHPKYYESQGAQAAPGDWEAPIPTYFLAMEPGVVFQFAVAPRDPLHPQARADANMAAQWLQEALYHLGAGAKTAVGYGYFEKMEKSR